MIGSSHFDQRKFEKVENKVSIWTRPKVGKATINNINLIFLLNIFQFALKMLNYAYDLECLVSITSHHETLSSMYVFLDS